MNPKAKPDKSEPKLIVPPIPDDRIDELFAEFSTPTLYPPGGLETVVWVLVEQLKGWLHKKAEPKDPLNLRFSPWSQLQEVLDAAVKNNDPALFDLMAKAWLHTDIQTRKNKLPTPSKPRQASIWTDLNRKTSQDEIDRSKNELIASSINNLVPAPSENRPNSPRKIMLLEVICVLQKKLKRVPTNKEIAEHLTRISIKHKISVEMDRCDIEKMTKEMGIELSRERVRKK